MSSSGHDQWIEKLPELVQGQLQGAERDTIDWEVDTEERERRAAAWVEPAPAAEGGVLLKYVRSVSSA